MTPIEHILVAASILLLLSVLASKASARLGIPALLLFLFVGMLAGSDGPGGIYFDDPRLAQSLGVVALALILFSGGLDTEWSSVRAVLWKGLALSTAGVLITAVLVGLFARIVLGFSLLEFEGLYPVLTLSLILLTYGATASLGGNGFLAVYIAGLVMGKNDFIHKRSVTRFHDGLAWLMQISMFLALGLLVFPSHLLPIAGLVY